VGPVTCERPDAIEEFGEPGLPLSILGQPKPQQARFYVAAGPNGASQDGGRLSKEEVGYREGKGLRGRKVYPHHRTLPQTYWDSPGSDKTQRADNLSFQEYRRPTLNNREQRDNQNRSVLGWIKPRTKFSFDLHVTNLSTLELGALVWLLSLEDGYFHRLGGGKPLGFGSARLTIEPDKTHLHTGESWKVFYSTLEDAPLPEVDRNQLIDSFKGAVAAAYAVGTHGTPAERFRQVPFIAAFLRAARGFDDKLPIHYPRARQPGQGGPVPPHPEGKAYEWFVANDRTGRDAGPRACLPDLANDPGLPMLDAP
jgi:CRISPR-associated protein (TIGR03986 family)